MMDKRVEAAAKAMAAAFDYPWDHMPEKGRESMRANSRAVLAAADAAAPQAVQAVDPWPQIRADFEYRWKAQGVNVSRLDSGAYLRPDVDRAWDALLRSYLPAQAVQAVGAVPDDVASAAEMFVANGYRGPLHMAQTVFDWVHALAATPPAQAQPTNPAPGYCKHCKQYTIEEPLPAQAQQAPTDERAAFEAWYEGNALPGEADWFRLDSMGDYKWSDTAACWEGWQARAALAAQRQEDSHG